MGVPPSKTKKEAYMNKNNMYTWTNRTRNFIGGECPHKCIYCYVRAFRFPSLKEKYSGKPFLIEEELSKGEGKGRTIFVQSCGDLFAEAIPSAWIKSVLAHCKEYANTYLFQSKNPKRFFDFISMFPEDSILGTTLESDIWYPPVSKAPKTLERVSAMSEIKGFRKMVSIEPILDFDLDRFVKILETIRPTFISIGADSKHNDLPEPDTEKVRSLIQRLRRFTGIRPKGNLKRLLDE
jgi:DNA repair photolyase